jgi:mRNA interferase RelE/StbE
VTAEPWSVEFERRADKDLERLDPQVKQRVLAAIERLASDPQSAALRRLSGRPESRLRVGDWRVIVELDIAAHAIVIQRILPRGPRRKPGAAHSPSEQHPLTQRRRGSGAWRQLGPACQRSHRRSPRLP